MLATLVTVELLARGSVVLEHLTRFKLRTVLVCESIHHVDILVCSILIHIAEWPTSEWSESGTEYKANVADRWILDNFIFQALYCLVHESIKWEYRKEVK